MRARTLLFSVLALVAVVAPPARADVVKERASLNYNAGAKRREFITDTFVAGNINIESNGVGKKLGALKEAGYNHSCVMTYDNDSKIQALNGDFYSVFKLSQCD